MYEQVCSLLLLRSSTRGPFVAALLSDPVFFGAAFLALQGCCLLRRSGLRLLVLSFHPRVSSSFNVLERFCGTAEDMNWQWQDRWNLTFLGVSLSDPSLLVVPSSRTRELLFRSDLGTSTGTGTLLGRPTARRAHLPPVVSTSIFASFSSWAAAGSLGSSGVSDEAPSRLDNGSRIWCFASTRRSSASPAPCGAVLCSSCFTRSTSLRRRSSFLFKFVSTDWICASRQSSLSLYLQGHPTFVDARR